MSSRRTDPAANNVASKRRRGASAPLDGFHAPTREERDAQLRWLLLLRIAIASALLAVTLYLSLFEATFALRPLFAVIGAVYGFSIAWAVLHRTLLEWPPFAGVQLSVDVLLATLLVFFMGGVQSPFVVLYVVIVAGAGVMLTRRGALYIAGLTVVCYGLVGLSAYGSLPFAELLPYPFQEAVRAGLTGDAVDASDLYLRLFAMALVSYAMAWLSYSTASRLRRTGSVLRTRQTQLRALRRLHERIIEGMSSGLMACDARGIVVTANGAAAEITGYALDELIGKEVWRLFGEDREFFDRLYERLGDNRVYRTDRTIRAADGERRNIGMTVGRLEAGGDDEAPQSVCVFLFRDLTEIKRLERELRIRERMSVLGQMAGSIAHEIRNPLASISGSLQLLGRSNLRSDDPNAEELIQIVVRESDRLSRTIEDFLEYARPGRFEPEEVDLAALVNDTVKLLRNSPELHAEHEIRVVAETGSFKATVDPSQIKQVFWNLARNALQAMPDGGVLTVTLKHIRRGIEISFEDTGEGMSPEEIETFFQPSVASKSRKGTGLGLAVVYRILDRHGVRIEVDSEVGKGTRCLLTFGGRVLTDAEDRSMTLPGGSGQEGPSRPVPTGR